MPDRQAHIKRTTRETVIELELNLDKPAPAPKGDEQPIETGVGFFDHMLDHVARHGRLTLSVQAQGDSWVDDHHTVEDVGIVLGQALGEALGDKKGIERYGFASVPMDEALARVSVDLSGRGAMAFAGAFSQPGARIGTFDVQLVPEFFQALAQSAKLACHIEVARGSNDHHIAEAIFKAFARALRDAVRITGSDVPSTKGSL